MNLAPYRLVLAQPGLRSVMVIGFLARIPATAASMAITLHVLTSLGLGYAQAGLAGALGMAGTAIGSPPAGRFIDRLGARPVLALTCVAQACYWVAAPRLSYGALVASAFVAGALSIPVFSVIRQCLAALVPADQRRTAFALDSIAVDLSYMLGPALAVAGITAFGSRFTLYAVGSSLVITSIGLIVLNPPTKSAAERADTAAAAPLRRWLTGPVGAVLIATAATTFVLAASELAVVATLRHDGESSWTGLVIGIWSGYSIIGGFLYGALRRTLSPLALIGTMSVLTIPIGFAGALFGGGWVGLALLLVPAGLLCAPSLASTVGAVSALVPPAVRGEAMGLHATALTIGIAAGAPTAGAVLDAFGARWGFAIAGGGGVLLVALVAPSGLRLRRQRQRRFEVEPQILGRLQTDGQP